MDYAKVFNKNYKLVLIIPTMLLLFSAATLVGGYLSTGEWFDRDIELKGGTLITLELKSAADIKSIEASLNKHFESSVKEFRGVSGYGVSISLGPDVDTNAVMEALRGMGVDTSASSIKQIGSAIGSSFWSQAQIGMMLAFIFMGVVVFIIFRDPIPSLAVILCAISDILSTLAFMQIFGIKFSLAALSAILMLIGYSVDSDIMLATNFMKKKGPFMERYKKAIKTGLMMTITSIGAIAALLMFPISATITSIASVLMIGLVMDIIYTWLQNSIIMKWYCEKRGLTN